MSAKTKSAKRRYRASHEGRSIPIYRWTHPKTGRKVWRFIWEDENGVRKYGSGATFEEAEDKALKILQEADKQEKAWLDLAEPRLRWLQKVHELTGAHPDDEQSVLDFLRNRQKSGNVTQAVERFMAFKITEAGEETPHLRTERLTLESMAKAFASCSVTDIHASELYEWWAAQRNKRTGEILSPKRRKDIRGTLVAFWNWCQREGIAGNDPVTVAERLPTPKVGNNTRRVLEPAELLKILAHIEPQWRAWAVLGAFAGLRPEEIAPSVDKVGTKRGLHIEEIDFKFSVIRLPAEVSKGGNRPRIIPLNEACRAALEWAGIKPGMKGPFCMENPADAKETARLGKLLFDGEWPQDALRHSYGSYRNAMIRNMPQVAEEMGNSVSMLNKHYHNPRTVEEGEAWFSLRPPFAICGSFADHRELTA